MKPVATSESTMRHVAEDLAAGERREDRGDDPGRRDEDDVDLGVAEEPEQVLPEQRVPPSAGLKKWVSTSRSRASMRLDSITAGMAKTTMKEVTSIDQT